MSSIYEFSVSDVLLPKEGAMELIRNMTIKDLMEPIGTAEWLEYNKNLANELDFKGKSDLDNIVGFDTDYTLENFPGGEEAFEEIIDKANFQKDYTVNPTFSGGLTVEVGTAIDNNGNDFKLIKYRGGMVDGYVARKEWLTESLTEGIGDLLKPKHEKEIIDNLKDIDYSDSDQHWYSILQNISNIVKYVKDEKYLDEIDNNWIFTAAIYNNNEDLVLKSILNGVDDYHNQGDIDSQTPDYYFASFIIKHPELFANDPNNKPKQKDLDSLLKRSCQLGFAKIAKYAIDKGANVNHKDNFGSTSLYYAAKNEELDAVKLLVENGANINEKNRDDVTACMAVLLPTTISHSSSMKAIDDNILWYLLDKGADPYIVNKYKGTLFDLSIKHGRVAILLLEKFGKKIITENSLRIIINSGTLKLLKKVLELGADPKKLKGYVRTAYLDDKHKESKLRVINEFEKLTEGVKDILRPKPEEEIIKQFSNKILSLLIQNKSVSFYKEWSTVSHKFNVSESTYLVDKSFKHSYEQHGNGLYIQLSIHASFANANPLKGLFPFKFVYQNSVIKYDVNMKDLEKAVTKLVDDAYKGKLGDGFHLHYFEDNKIKYFDEVNEDLYQDDEDRQNKLNKIFKPKPKEDIKNKLIKEILKSYTETTVQCRAVSGSFGQNPHPGIEFGTGEQFMQKMYGRYGSGIYIQIDDTYNSPVFDTLANKFYEKNIAFSRLATLQSTFKILSTDKIEMFLPSLIDDLFDKKIWLFRIRKFL